MSILMDGLKLVLPLLSISLCTLLLCACAASFDGKFSSQKDVPAKVVPSVDTEKPAIPQSSAERRA